MYPRYGQPNDLLVSLNINNFTVKDVPVKPLYNVEEISGLKIRKVFSPSAGSLLGGFLIG